MGKTERTETHWCYFGCMSVHAMKPWNSALEKHRGRRKEVGHV